MSDNINRKACDRCHHQKLSCKRINDGSCERCTRIQITCTWSPSLRYRKQQEKLQQQQQSQQTQKQKHKQKSTVEKPNNKPKSESSTTGPGSQQAFADSRRSPKRRRTGSDPRPVSPESVPIAPPSQPQPGTGVELPTSTTASNISRAQSVARGLPEAVAAAESSVSVTPVPADLGIREFDFSLGQVDFFQASSQHHLHHQQQQEQQQQHISQPGLQSGLNNFHHHHHQHLPQHQQQQLYHQSPGLFLGQWDQAINSSHHGFLDTSPAPQQLPTPNELPSGQIIRSYPLVQRSRPSSVTCGINSTPRRRPRKHIALRAGAQSSAQEAEPNLNNNQITQNGTPLHWMAQLTEINARLQALSILLPHQYNANNEGARDHSFPVDEMFQLTRHIADILDQITVKDINGNAVSRSAGAQVDAPDPGSSMFIISVYVMLLDLYHKVFTLVRSEVFQHASTATFAFWKLPDVTIGSFAVQSTPSLQMSLTIQLAEEFLSRLRASTAVLDPSRKALSPGAVASATSEGSMFASVVDVSYQELKSSEESLRLELAALRDRIESMLEG